MSEQGGFFHTDVFVEVILPVPVPNTFHYGFPPELGEPLIGGRVIVPFGKRKLYTGVIKGVTNKLPADVRVKSVHESLDERPVITPLQLELMDWVRRYYMSAPGDVLNAVVPGQLLVSSETRIIATGESPDEAELDDQEYMVMEALSMQDEISVLEAGKILGLDNPMKVVKGLMGKRLVASKEELVHRYKPKVRQYLVPAEHLTEASMPQTMADLEKAPKQLEALMKFVQLSRFGTDRNVPVLLSDLVKSVDGARAAVNGLVSKGILEAQQGHQSRLVPHGDGETTFPELSDEQQQAYTQIIKEWESKTTVLLRGVTASGKTEVYSHLIKSIIDQGGQVLFLVPEIALTSQLVNRLSQYFGDAVGVYHSRLSPAQRVEVWQKMLEDDPYKIVLGARSSLFLPFHNLKLVIIDEEHDQSYKQFDPSPRYQARDAAIWLSNKTGAKVLLGSATPSVESLYHASQAKYGAASMEQRYGNAQLPEILVADLSREKRRKTMNEFLSSFLIEQVEQTLKNEEQVILFQNRRGYAPFMQCDTCGYVIQCPSCDVSLTYHKGIHKLRCHYCGHQANMPTRCSSCGDHRLSMMSFGTEKIEDHLKTVFPKAKVKRMDLDTTRGKYAFQELMDEFESGQVDILVGTQMVTKGLDFSNVGLVGIIDADHLLNYPDFRAHERAFQLMTQVAGRSGRKGKKGKVVIQSQRPDHNTIRYVMEGKWRDAYKEEIIQRRNFGYPPFKRMVKIVLSHPKQDKLEQAVGMVSHFLKSKYGEMIIGPEYPLIPRLKNQYYKVFLVKIDPAGPVAAIKKDLDNLVREGLAKSSKSVRLYFDVDPY